MNYLILFIIIASILGAFILLFLMDVIFLLVFKTKIDLRGKAISLILNQNFDTIKSIISLLEEISIDVSECQNDLNNINTKNFSNCSSLIFKEELNKISTLKMKLISKSNKNKKITSNESYKLYFEILSSSSDQLRSAISSYNSYVTGYNYWVNFSPCSIINKALGLEIKSNIQ